MTQRRRLNLRSRVLVSFIAAAVVLLSVNMVLTRLITSELYNNTDRQLQEEAAAILSSTKNQSPSVVASGVGALAFSQVVVISTGYGAAKDITMVGPTQGQGAVTQFASGLHNLTGTAGGWRFARAVDLVRQTSVTVGISLQSLDLTHSRIILELFVATSASLAVIAILSVWMVSIGIRPLVEMAKSAHSVTAGALDTRVALSQRLRGTEAADVAQAFNSMLTSLEELVRREEGLNGELRRFVADAGHELRTPLTSISGYTELLAAGTLSPEAEEEALSRIRSESARMGRLVEDLLALARLEGRSGMRVEYFDLSDMVTNLVHDHQTVDETRPVTVTTPGPLFVSADFNQLASVFSNLLVNLRVHTQEGTSASISLSSRADNVLIQYNDDGPGVADVDALFTRFWQADRGRDTPGTGLGMAIVAAALRAHGGSVTATSAPGQGLHLRMVLPCTPHAPTPGDSYHG